MSYLLGNPFSRYAGRGVSVSFSLSVGAFHGFLARIRTGFRREDIQQPFRKSGFPSCPFLFQGGIPMGIAMGSGVPYSLFRTEAENSRPRAEPLNTVLDPWSM